MSGGGTSQLSLVTRVYGYGFVSLSAFPAASSFLTAILVGGTAFLVLLGAFLTSVLARPRKSEKATIETRKDSEDFFQSLSEAIPGMIWTARADGSRDYFNKRWCDYTGLRVEQGSGMGWLQAFHPDDVTFARTCWENAMRTGEPYGVECRLRAKDGTYRWFLGRGNPIRDEKGEIIKWFGTITDIEDQKQNQQILEQQILERTMQLAEANTRLQQEMEEKDFARNQLDQQNDKMMNELEKRSERATMLAKLGELLQSCISRDEVIAAALGFAPRIFPATRGAVALLNPSRSSAEVIGSWTECQISTVEFEPTACWALRTGHPHLVPAGDPTAPCAHAAGVKDTYLCIPILAQGETLGILHLQATSDGPNLQTAELSFKTTFAGQVGLSIANIKLREALRTQSVRDALTGLYNRRYLEETLEREMRRALRAHQPLGVLMIDLDHFKTFNDTYGHEAGDAILRETAAFLTRSVRAEDFVCRFGGEEFVIVLPTANLEIAHARAEALRLKISELTVLHQGRSMGLVSISVGVAEFPQHGKAPKELMAAADAALYEAKRGGRNRVVVASSQVVEEGVAPVAVMPEPGVI